MVAVGKRKFSCVCLSNNETIKKQTNERTEKMKIKKLKKMRRDEAKLPFKIEMNLVIMHTVKWNVSVGFWRNWISLFVCLFDLWGRDAFFSQFQMKNETNKQTNKYNDLSDWEYKMKKKHRKTIFQIINTEVKVAITTAIWCLVE